MNAPPAIEDLPAFPRDDAGPVFREPWQAHAFALAVRLAETGVFTWPEWASFLAEEIRSAHQRGDPDLGATYYHHWLAALEKLCALKNLFSGADMETRQEQWRAAYLNTPHGRPIELAAGLSSERSCR